jgi:tripartite-type tricarboxylate transporter receptor subunit TctC
MAPRGLANSIGAGHSFEVDWATTKSRPEPLHSPFTEEGLMQASHLRRALLAVAAAGALVVAAPPSRVADAQGDYPNKKITFMVGFAPGGGIDTLARVLAQELFDQFGYQIVIENRPGAASNIAARAVAKAEPDGYTVLVTGNSLAINQTYYKNPGYTIDELAPIAFAARDGMALAVNASNPAKTLSEFVVAHKDKPFSFGFGGSSARIGSEYVFKVLLKTKATGVPFQSGAPALNALLGNHVDIIAGPIAEIYPHVLQGNLRALVVTGPQRTRALPNVPTLSEAGLEGIQIYGWNGFLGPARMPKEVALKLNGAINVVVKKPGVDSHLRMLGYEPYTLDLADAPAFLKNSVESWARMIRATGITED